MSNIELHKSKNELEIIDKLYQKLLNDNEIDMQIGDVFYSTSYGLIKLIDITFGDREDVYNGYNVTLFFEHLEESRKGNSPHRTNLSDFLNFRHHYFKINSSVEEFQSDLLKISNNESSLEELMMNHFDSGASGSTEIMSMNKDVLLDRKKELIAQSNYAMARSEAVKALLERKMRKMQELASGFKKYIGKLNRLIWSIELYLGIKEELVQLQVGSYAPATDLIHLRQRVLYMDVEMGDPTEDLGGIDFRNIEDFDGWLLKENTYWKKKNYEILVPESKCVVIFRVRKDAKEYGTSNPWVNMQMNKENFKTYILIRNGDNIFRIYADVIIGNKLFPDSLELEKLFEDAESNKISSSDKEKSADSYERYKLNIILLQGIIERTPCFPDNQYNTSLFNPDTVVDKIKYVYDDSHDKMLPTNVLSFESWRKKLNETLGEGSRIIYDARVRGYMDKEYRMDYLFKNYYPNKYSVPDSPHTGVYTVLREDSKKHDGTIYNRYFIKYNPQDTVTHGWNDYEDRVRKNRLSWEVFFSDNHIINYDAISRKELNTLEFYLYTRIGRENYLKYMPMLTEILKTKKAEIAEEDNFIRLTLNQAGLDETNDFQKGVDAMEWWKLKNKWKRALNVDDAKALRMIVKELKK